MTNDDKILKMLEGLTLLGQAQLEELRAIRTVAENFDRARKVAQDMQMEAIRMRDRFRNDGNY